jgi:hypothetical protein
MVAGILMGCAEEASMIRTGRFSAVLLLPILRFKPPAHPPVELLFRRCPTMGDVIQSAVDLLADIDVILDAVRFDTTV